MGVIVQETIDSISAGVMFSINPVSDNLSEIVINSCWGLGIGAASHVMNLDSFSINKKSLGIKQRHIAQKAKTTRPPPSGFTKDFLTPKPIVGMPSLQDEQILELSRICMETERIFGVRQNIEWAINGEKIYIIQSRPVISN
jgi:pyruvate,water dikinase